jgi:cytochrome P450
MTTAFRSEEIDLLSVSTFRNGHPFALYTHLRETDPVHRHAETDGPGFWAVTRWEDIRFVNQRDDLFAHAPSSLVEEAMTEATPSLVVLDAPAHNELRKHLIPDFLPAAIRARVPSFRSAAEDIVAEARGLGRCDLVVDVAGRMASYVAGDMLGIPREDAVQLYDFVEVGLAGGEHTSEVRLDARQRLRDYAAVVWDDRRAHPRDDVATRLAESTVGGEPITRDAFCANFALLVVGAGDTTRHLIAGGMLALLEHPDQLALLRSDPEGLMPAAVEEMLRWVTPVIYNRRMTKEDLVLRGRQIRRGDKVIVYYGSGNRDPDVFAAPDVFDVTRSPNPHVAFSGQGAHFCLGAHVARAEAIAMLTVLLREAPEMELAGELSYERSNMVMGPEHMPVAL